MEAHAADLVGRPEVEVLQAPGAGGCTNSPPLINPTFSQGGVIHGGVFYRGKDYPCKNSCVLQARGALHELAQHQGGVLSGGTAI